MKGFIKGNPVIYGIYRLDKNNISSGHKRDWYAEKEKKFIKKIFAEIVEKHDFPQDFISFEGIAFRYHRISIMRMEKDNFCPGCSIFTPKGGYCERCRKKIGDAEREFFRMERRKKWKNRREKQGAKEKKNEIKKRDKKKKLRKCRISGCVEKEFDCRGLCQKHHDEYFIPFFEREKGYKKAKSEEEIKKSFQEPEEQEIVKDIRKDFILLKKKKAIAIAEEMKIIEGKDFMDKVLDGLPQIKKGLKGS